jgi:hypothetical protein
MFLLKTIEKSQLIEDENIALEDADDGFLFFPCITMSHSLSPCVS